MFRSAWANGRSDMLDERFDDLKHDIRSEFKRVDERIDRLERPLARK